MDLAAFDPPELLVQLDQRSKQENISTFPVLTVPCILVLRQLLQGSFCLKQETTIKNKQLRIVSNKYVNLQTEGAS